MAVITISRGSYSKGKEVAEGIATALGYECISRDILLEASDRFNIPEIKLLHAMHDAPSILDRGSHGQIAYITYIQSSLLEHVKEGDVVYHGLAGHLLLKEIDKVLKVRILANPDLRIAVVKEREQVGEKEARKMIAKVDEARRKWTRRLYGVDPWDPSLYDLVICIDKIKVDGAIHLIRDAASQEAFQLTEKDRRKLADLTLACKLKSELLDLDPNVTVTSDYGNVLVFTKADDRKARKMEEKLRSLAGKFSEMHNLEVRVGEPKLSADA
jgi:cytidylate kinase